MWGFGAEAPISAFCEEVWLCGDARNPAFLIGKVVSDGAKDIKCDVNVCYFI